MRVQPVRFQHIFKEKVWGGRAFSELMGLDLPPDGSFGESWEVSVRPESISRVCGGDLAGISLSTLLADAGQDWLGADRWRRYGGQFPLLVKFLDINDRLSVQVHPNDSQAQSLGLGKGKSECWYVLHASPNARLILGTAKGIDHRFFEQQVRSGDWRGLFNEVVVKPGDFIHIPPGTVHASLEGSLLVCEIQQDSDATLRLYDFDRLDHGRVRSLHLEAALGVIQFDQKVVINGASERSSHEQSGAQLQRLVRDADYSVDFLNIGHSFIDLGQAYFRIYSVIAGSGNLVFQDTSHHIQIGETWFVPANCAVEFQGQLELLCAWV